MISPFAGRRLPSRPTAEAGPACSSAHLPRAPRSACPALRRARSRASRPDHARALPPRGGHAPSTLAARQPWPAFAPTRPPSSAEAAALATPFSRAASLLRPHALCSLASERHRSPAGRIRCRCSTTASNQAYLAPPHSTAPGPRGCDAFEPR